MKVFLLLLVFSALAYGLVEKKYKPFSEWTAEDAQKILVESPWVYSSPLNNTDREDFTDGPSEFMAFRLLSAKPIRQAFIRAMAAETKQAPAKLASDEAAFLNANYDDRIVITGVIDRRTSGFMLKQTQGAAGSWFLMITGNYGIDGQRRFPRTNTLEQLKKDTYLKLKDGRKIYLTEYHPPANGTFGAQFVFPRTIEGKPVLEVGNGHIEFFTTMDRIARYAKFKAADLMYEEKLEY
jgi:hypothetical protein